MPSSFEPPQAVSIVTHSMTVSSTENNRTFTFVFPPDFLRNIFCFVREKAIDAPGYHTGSFFSFAPHFVQNMEWLSMAAPHCVQKTVARTGDGDCASSGIAEGCSCGSTVV